jgi:serine/threonine-protein kinase
MTGTGPWLSRPGEPDEPPARPSGRLEPGARLDGGYRILSVLSEGGMGAVYAAEREGAGARVALKVLLHAGGEDRGAQARFLAEARAAAGFAHRNLVPVTDAGTTPGGRPFLVMPLLEGESLAELLAARGPLDEPAAAAILRQILAGLRAVHERGIVHRDLKPGNLFLCREGRPGPVVRILDFGVALFPGSVPVPAGVPGVVADPPAALRLTRGGRVMGTPGYLAPELAANERAADPRADLFSAAVVAFELLTGRLPFTGRTVRELLEATVAQPAPPPRSLRPGISPALEELILRGLAKRPEERFASAAEFLARLEAACPPSRGGIAGGGPSC